MGKSFFVSGFRDGDPRGGKDVWVDTEMQMREEGNRQHGTESIPLEERPIIDPRTGRQAIHPITGKPRSRRVRPDASTGIDSENYHYKGDRIVKLAEEVEVKGGKPTGELITYIQRVRSDGRLGDTLAIRSERLGNGRIVTKGDSARRIWGGF